MIKPKKSLEEIAPYKTDFYKQQWRLKLDANENIYGTSSAVVNVIKNFCEEDISLYPCYGKLIDKLSARYELEKDEILITNGCDEALSVIINTYLEAEDEILSYNPSFSMPLIYAKCAGAKIKLIEYDEKFIFNKEKFANNISSETKIAYIATPNNPTGGVTKASVVDSLAKNYNNTLFVIDCTYVNYSDEAAFGNYLDLIKKYNNVVITKSFSKDFALAGLRIGFAAGQKEIIENLKKVISPYSVNTVALNCAIAAINSEKKFDEIKEANEEARELLISGLSEHGFKPYPSQANFVLCDFYNYADFYYEKFKKNGVIVRNYPKDSSIKTYLRITVPKPGGVKYILELLNKKDMLIFDLDGVVFDVTNSYMSAIAQTFKYFSGLEIDKKEILDAKNLGGMNCDWDATKYLLEKHGFNIALSDVIKVFQDLFYNPKIKGKKYLIDEEKLLISKEIFAEFAKKYDMVVFSGRLKEEVIYSLEKFGIDKYFYYFITSDDLPKSMLKPHPKGALEILEHCPYLSIKYLGDSVDDIIAGNAANIDTIGVISPGSDYNAMVNNFRHLGAKYILGDISNIETFLEEIEKEEHGENE